MNKQNLKCEMERFCGGSAFIRKYQLAKFMGMKDPHSCDKYLSRLERVGKEYYFIPDVCEELLNG